MNFLLVKYIVDGEIQTILHCIFSKFSFLTNGCAMNENDAKIDNCSLVYFPMFSSLSELLSPTYIEFFMYNYKFLFSITSL